MLTARQFFRKSFPSLFVRQEPVLGWVLEQRLFTFSLTILHSSVWSICSWGEYKPPSILSEGSLSLLSPLDTSPPPWDLLVDLWGTESLTVVRDLVPTQYPTETEAATSRRYGATREQCQEWILARTAHVIGISIACLAPLQSEARSGAWGKRRSRCQNLKTRLVLPKEEGNLIPSRSRIEFCQSSLIYFVPQPNKTC